MAELIRILAKEHLSHEANPKFHSERRTDSGGD